MQRQNAKHPLILLSGMGADERLFAPQRELLGDQLVTPRWITPIEGESIAAYARRFAEQVDPHQPCFVGGASFGGFVAMEMANHLRAHGIFLIGSVRGPNELPHALRALKPIRHFLSFIPFELLKRSAALTTTSAKSSVLQQFSDADANFLRWAGQAVLDWGATPSPRAPVYQIHGSADVVLPPRCTRPDVVVPNAGHLLSLTHSQEVNRFLVERMNAPRDQLV